MKEAPEYPINLINPPMPFSPFGELFEFRQKALDVLAEYPSHPQWLEQLKEMDQYIADAKQHRSFWNRESKP